MRCRSNGYAIIWSKTIRIEHPGGDQVPDPDDRPYLGPTLGPDPRFGPSAVPVLVRPDGALLPGVDDEAAWPAHSAHSADELHWSFGCDLAEAFAGLIPSITAPAEGDQEQFLADLEALDRAEMATARPAAPAANPSTGPGTAASAGDRGAGPGTAASAGDRGAALGRANLGAGDRGAAPGGASPSDGAA